MTNMPVHLLGECYLRKLLLFSRLVMSDSLCPWTAARQAPLSFTISRSLLNSCPLSRWCHPTISSSVVTFSSCLQSFPASGSFPVSQLFASGGQSTGASVSILPMNIQDWFPLGWTGWISLQSKGLSRVFSNTTVQKHQFFGAQPSLCSNSHIHTWLLEKTALTTWTSDDPCGGNLMWGIQGATVSLKLYYKSKAIQSKVFI